MRVCENASCAPSGLLFNPRLPPWALFLRRFAASNRQGYSPRRLTRDWSRTVGLQEVSITMGDVNCRSIRFLLPALAVLSMTAAAAQKTAKSPPLPDCGPLAGQILRCPKVGFIYKVPFGWVDRTEDMQESASTAPSKSEKNSEQATAEPRGKTLLAAFERPPGTSGSDVNSAVIIAVEDGVAYPQVKTAADYFAPLAGIAEQRGFKMDGDPYSFSVGARQVVRGDFTGGDEKHPIRQTSLVLLEKGYILSLTFLAGSDDEIDSLVENLTFNSTQKRTPSK